MESTSPTCMAASRKAHAMHTWSGPSTSPGLASRFKARRRSHPCGAEPLGNHRRYFSGCSSCKTAESTGEIGVVLMACTRFVFVVQSWKIGSRILSTRQVFQMSTRVRGLWSLDLYIRAVPNFIHSILPKACDRHISQHLTPSESDHVT